LESAVLNEIPDLEVSMVMPNQKNAQNQSINAEQPRTTIRYQGLGFIEEE
jgi:hypothetical protein